DEISKVDFNDRNSPATQDILAKHPQLSSSYDTASKARATANSTTEQLSDLNARIGSKESQIQAQSTLFNSPTTSGIGNNTSESLADASSEETMCVGGGGSFSNCADSLAERYPNNSTIPAE